MVSTAQIRAFRWQDLEQFTDLHNQVNGTADSEKAYDLEFMRQFLSQPSCDPEANCFVVESNGGLVGYALVHPEPRVGRTVATGGVLTSHRGRGIGRRLVRKALQWAELLKASVVHIQAPSDGADAHHILVTEGFRTVRRYWQMRRQADEVPSQELPESFSFRSLSLGQDEEALTELQNIAFGQNWGFSPNTVEEIRARVRLKRCDPEGIIFVADRSRLVAYNWTMTASGDAGSTGWIAMTGVHPDYTGRGLGRAVVVAGMHYLKAKGVDGIELEVDSENVPARALYLKLGFEKIRETLWYEKRPGDSP